MKIKFQNRLEAIDWIANFAKHESQFEVLREQLIFNEIYTGKFYLHIDKKEQQAEIIMLNAS